MCASSIEIEFGHPIHIDWLVFFIILNLNAGYWSHYVTISMRYSQPNNVHSYNYPLGGVHNLSKRSLKAIQLSIRIRIRGWNNKHRNSVNRISCTPFTRWYYTRFQKCISILICFFSWMRKKESVYFGFDRNVKNNKNKPFCL